VAIPYFSDIRAGLYLREYPERAFGLLTVITLLHWIANIYLSVDEHKHPTRLFPFLRDLALFAVLPVLPLFGVLMQAAQIGGSFLKFVRPHYQPTPYVPLALFATILFCPVVTFSRLRFAALRISRPGLARHIRIAAFGMAISLAFFGAAQAIAGSSEYRVIQNIWLALVFALIPRAMLMFFSLSSLYVLFELSGLLMRFGRDGAVRPMGRVGIQ
jgi:hypothetical protein